MRWLMKLILPAVLLLVTGCVAGQSIKMAYEPLPAGMEKLGIRVQVISEDQRDFIVNGTKQPNYIGHYRAGFGNTWDVTTENKQPLANNLQADVSADLNALGFDVVDKDAARVLKIVVHDWNFDTYINGKVWYQVHVAVESATGEILASSDLEDTVVIEGNIWTGAKYAFEREVPKIYQTVVSKIARNNQQVLDALKTK